MRNGETKLCKINYQATQIQNPMQKIKAGSDIK